MEKEELQMLQEQLKALIELSMNVDANGDWHVDQEMVKAAKDLAQVLNEHEKTQEKYVEAENQLQIEEKKLEFEKGKLEFEREKLRFEREKADKEDSTTRLRSFVDAGVQILKVVVFILGIAYNFKMAAAWMAFEKTAVVPRSMAAFVSTKLPKML